MTMIRAKFRCMSVTRKWDGHEIVEFKPVNRSGDQDPENQKFWDATPSGEAQLTFKGPCGYEPGDYYYIDMGQSEDAKWFLHSVTRTIDNAGEVYFHRSWAEIQEGLEHGSVKMWINFPETLDLFGAPDSKWAVTFTHAEPNDGASTPC